LDVLDYIEIRSGNPKDVLSHMFLLLIEQRENSRVEISKISNKSPSIEKIIKVLDTHFTDSKSYGKSRLPVLAIHSIYTLLVNELDRYEGKILQELSSHTSADIRKGDVGDVQVNNTDGEVFEAVEVKYGIKISRDIISFQLLMLELMK